MPRTLLHAFLLGSTSLLLVATVGCDTGMPEDTPMGDAPADRSGGDVAEGEQDIINGTADNENDAVCALMVEQGGGLGPFCTGTVIGKNGSTAYAISAAHCIEEGATPDYLVCTDTYGECPGGTCKVYPVTDVAVHPEYDGTPSHDVSMITIGQAADAVVIPALQTDGLAEGDALEFSGYGVTNGFNETPSNRRNHSFSYISTLYLDAIEAPQSHDGQYGGTCFGDSGGPVLIGSGASKNIVGVTSQGDENCDQVGYYARIQYNWPFISQYMGAVEGPDCNECANQSLQGACASQYQACIGDAECSAFWDCIDACADDACVQQCSSTYPNGANLYVAMIDCAFCQACDAACQDPACGSTSASTGAGTGAGATTGATTGAGGGGVGGGGSGGGEPDDDDGDDDASSGGDEETTTTQCACTVPGDAAPVSNPALLVGIALAAGLVGRRGGRRSPRPTR
jgi:hypothetical protein